MDVRVIINFNQGMRRKDRYAGIMLKWRLFDLLPEDMTQEKIADFLDCSVATVNMIKSGKRNPDARMIELAARKLNIPTWHLFAKPEDVTPWRKPTVGKVVDDVRYLTPEEKEELKNYLNAQNKPAVGKKRGLISSFLKTRGNIATYDFKGCKITGVKRWNENILPFRR